LNTPPCSNQLPKGFSTPPPPLFFLDPYFRASFFFFLFYPVLEHCFWISPGVLSNQNPLSYRLPRPLFSVQCSPRLAAYSPPPPPSQGVSNLFPGAVTPFGPPFPVRSSPPTVLRSFLLPFVWFAPPVRFFFFLFQDALLVPPVFPAQLPH